jgi:CRP/FNR family transcriptional activator FtrB
LILPASRIDFYQANEPALTLVKRQRTITVGKDAMRPQESSFVRHLPLFREMSEDNFATLMNVAFLQRFPAHLTLITEGALPDFLHIVVDGTAELFAQHDGQETTLDIVRPVASFILAAVIRDEVYLKSARTLAPSQILMVPAQTVRDVFGRDAAFARAVVNELAECYRGVVRALKNEKLRTGTERLANWILREDVRQGQTRMIALTMDKRTLASRLGMTPENLSRNLGQLTAHGVRTSGRGIVIEDISALNKFAKPNALIDG